MTSTIIELIHMDEAKKIAALDAPSVSTSPKYAQENTVAYYIAINSWLLMVRDYSGYAHVYLGDAIKRSGLIPIIKECQDDADLVIRGNFEQLSTLGTSIFADITSYIQHNRLEVDSQIGKDATVTLLFLLRYLKRFSPSLNDKIKDQTLADFIATENRTKLLQRREYSRFVVNLVRKEVMDMYPWNSLCDRIEARGPQDLRFSSGAGFDSKPFLGSKLDRIAHNSKGVYYFPQPFGCRMLDIPRETEQSDVRMVRVTAVPKSYKASRIIAMEDTYRLAIAKDIEYIFREFDSVYHKIALEDQTINQEYARLGSIDGYYATLDASHASDMISKTLFRELFPSRYVALVEPLLGNYCQVGKKEYLMQMSSTSGHALTFRHETIVYKAIALAADALHCRLSGEGTPFAWAYGDDVIIPSRSAEIAEQFYARLGLVINMDKSFYGTDILYRESCGEEYRNGTRFTTLFFPRFPVVGQATKEGISLDARCYRDEYRGKLDNSLTMLIDLQKKLFNFSRSASTFLFQVVKMAYPRMTSSLAGTICTDLWGYQDTGVARAYHAYAIEEDSSLPYRSQRRASRKVVRLRDSKGKPLNTLPLSQAAAKLFSRAAKLETMHYCPSVSYALSGKITAEQERIYDMYRYQDFLRHGPRYSDPLMELLGVSEPPVPISHVYGKKRLVLTLK